MTHLSRANGGTDSQTGHGWKTVARRCGWMLVLALVALLAIPRLLPLTGLNLIIVDGGSMAPTYAVGDVLVAAPATESPLRVGQIVVVGTPPQLVTHRVVEVDGERARLRGDANTTIDPGWITADDVFGLPVLHIPAPLSALVALAAGPAGAALLAALAGGALLLWWQPWRQRRPPDRP